MHIIGIHIHNYSQIQFYVSAGYCKGEHHIHLCLAFVCKDGSYYVVLCNLKRQHTSPHAQLHPQSGYCCFSCT